MRHSYSNIYDLAHGFFYDPQDGERCYTNGGSASFKDDRFISYGTCIGYVVKDKYGDKVLLVSDDTFSVTTAKHIRYLINACPFSWIRVPMNYGHEYSGLTQAEIIGRIGRNLEYLITKEMAAKYTYTRAAQRESSQHLLSMTAKFIEKTGVKVKGAIKFKNYLDKKLSVESIKKASARARQQAKIKAEKTRKLVEKFKKKLATGDVYPLIEKYFFGYKLFTKEELLERELLEKSFDVERPSFVRVDKENGRVITSQRVSVTIDEVKPLLKLWKHKHNIVGLNLAQFTVLANNDKMVKIGCHNIPVANIQALADLLL